MGRRRQYEPAKDMSYKESFDTYEPYGLTIGDQFKAKGEYGATFTFKEYVRTRGGDEWITCYGGSKEYATWRSFRIDKVKPPKKKRQKRLDAVGGE